MTQKVGSGTKKVCFDIDRNNDGLQDWDVNCSTLSEAEAEKFKLLCTTCKTGFYAETASVDKKSFCYQLKDTFLPECKKWYDPALNDLDATTDLFNLQELLCLECTDVNTHYFNSSVCAARTIVPNCATYEPNSNACTADTGCSAGFYYNNGACPALPSGSSEETSIAGHKGYIRSCSAYSGC